MSSPIGSISAEETPPPFSFASPVIPTLAVEATVSAATAAVIVSEQVQVMELVMEPHQQPAVTQQLQPPSPSSRAEQKTAAEASAAATSVPALSIPSSSQLPRSILFSPQPSTPLQPELPLRSSSVFASYPSMQQKASEHGIQLTTAAGAAQTGLWATIALADPSERQRIRQEQQQKQTEMKD